MQIQGRLGFSGATTTLVLKKTHGWLTTIYVQPKQLSYKAGCKFCFASNQQESNSVSSIIGHAQHGFQASLRVCLSSLPTMLISAIRFIRTRATTTLAIRAEGWLLPVHVSECGGHCS